MREELTLLQKQIQHSNPSFTTYSLRRTVENIIIKVNKLPFMSIISEDKIDEIIREIPKEWEIIIRSNIR